MELEVRAPQQQRSRRSLERVLATGADLLAEGGYDGLSIADVSRRSGVSVGSIYQRFGSKAALFDALQEAILARIDAEQAALYRDVDPGCTDAELVSVAVHRMAEHSRKHEALLKVMILRGAVDEATRQRGSRSSMVAASSFEALLKERVKRFRHPDPALACDVAFRIVYASLTRRIMSGSTFESATELPWPVFVDELAEVCRAYLLG
jgi:AcrR family transcriptional regulator